MTEPNQTYHRRRPRFDQTYCGRSIFDVEVRTLSETTCKACLRAIAADKRAKAR